MTISKPPAKEEKNKNCCNDDEEQEEEDKWIYRGKRLKHLDFPLGGIGTGNILLQGDGCLRGWDIQNQFHSPEHRPLHNLPSLNGSISSSSSNANCWAISAIYDDDDDEADETTTDADDAVRPSFLLRSANHYGIRGESGCRFDKTAESENHHESETEQSHYQHEHEHEIQTKQQSKPLIHSLPPPSVPELSIRARYPIAVVSYETPPSFPVSDIELEAMTPLVPTDSKSSGYPMAVFVLSFSNPHPTKSVSVDVMQSTMNFIGWDGGGGNAEETTEAEQKNCRTKRNGNSDTAGTPSDYRCENHNRNIDSTRDNTTNTAITEKLPSCLWGGNINEPFVYSTAPASPPLNNTEVEDLNSNKLNCSSSRRESSTEYSCTGLFLHINSDLKEDLARKGSIAISAICRNKTKNYNTAGTATTAATNNNNNNDDDDDTTTDAHPTPTIRLIKSVSSEKELFRRFATRDFEDPDPDQPTPPSPEGTTYACAVVQSFSKIPPRSRATVTFCLSWHFPYRPCTTPRAKLPPDFYGNLYASWFSDAKDVAVKFCDTFSAAKRNAATARSISISPRMSFLKEKPWPTPMQLKQKLQHSASTKTKKNLLEITRRFVESLYKSTIPWEILESAAGRLAIPRSPTLFRTEAGIVLGNAGNEKGPLNGTHVYGYTTLLEKIFPDLAQDMVTSAFVRNFDLETGGCLVSFGEGGFAIDGALASVIKVYLVVLQSDPGFDFLGTVWPNIKRQMEALLDNKHIDPRDGVISGPQQTTYGGPMNGANTMVGSYLVTALKASQAMANFMGDVNFAKKCSKQAQKSSDGYEARCWRGDFGYYVADVDESDCENSYGTGCFLDQLVAVGLSRACGFGCSFDPIHEASARRSIVRDNVVQNTSFRDENSRLCYGELGLRVCTYPHGRLGEGMPSSDKVASGLEYPLVAGLIGDENWEDAIRVCSFVRARQSGVHKSPWNEPECGLYAARSMSGWNLYDQACGLTYDSTKASIIFLPKIHSESFSCFCTFHQGFGALKQETNATNDAKFSSGKFSFKVLYGSIELQKIQLYTTAHVVVASLDGQSLNGSIAIDGVVAFDTKITIGEDSMLILTLSSPCYTRRSVFPIEIREGKASSTSTVSSYPNRFPLSSKGTAWQGARRSRMRCLGIIFVGISILYWWIISLSYFPSLSTDDS
jgi:hypothetical protein